MGKWKQFIQAHEVLLPSIVSGEEARHYYDSSGWQSFIILTEDINSGRVSELETSVVELVDTGNMLTSVDIHKGELQAITILRQEKKENLLFCTGDRGAIIACCLLGLETRCISLEKALKICGLTAKVEMQSSEEYMKKWKRIGFKRKAMDKGWSQI